MDPPQQVDPGPRQCAGDGFTMRDPYFWSNRPLTAGRLRTVVDKVKVRGWRWAWQRLCRELHYPETTQGVNLRRINAGIYAIVAHGLLLLPALVLRLVGRRTLTLFYDLDVAPVTFDVIDYLMVAELERRRRGLARIHVVIVPGRADGLRAETPEYEAAVDHAMRRWRLHNLVVPLLSLLPTCSGYTLCSSRRQATVLRLLTSGAVHPPSYWPAFPKVPLRRLLFDAARAGVPIFPGLQVPEQGLRYVRAWLSTYAADRRAVVITLRQYGYSPARNSNMAAWIDFARRLDKRRYVPVFVLDIATTMERPVPELEEFMIFREAPFNMTMRAALYQMAWLNICQAHGPTELMWYNEQCRYLIFFTLGSSPETQAEFLRGYGMEPGETPAFARPHQRWVWAPDDLPNIEREFLAMANAIDDAATHERSASRSDRVDDHGDQR
ncbi:MAG: hypothetical protein IT537_22955 [Hyphomicrobiales bacterium]|nr:hypothetical protein [Hyphomicrobiales bacterium]